MALPEEPTDPDVDLHLQPQRTELGAAVLGAISAGGALGAGARYGMTLVLAAPWAILVTNVVGCLLIGILIVLVTDVWPRRRLVRPFVGVGVLGGFTTFSTYVVDIRQGAGVAYAVLTVVAALGAVWLGLVVTRWAVRRWAA